MASRSGPERDRQRAAPADRFAFEVAGSQPWSIASLEEPSMKQGRLLAGRWYITTMED